MRAQGHSAYQLITGVEIVRPPAQVGELLELDASGVAAVRRRLRYVNDAAFATADSYFPEDVVRGTPIMLPEDIETGGRHILADLGFPMERHVDRIRSRGLTPDEAARLRVPTGTPVFVHTRASGPASGPNAGRIVRVMVTVMPADRVEIVVDQGIREEAA
jgi:GntR family transcriptional regulator